MIIDSDYYLNTYCGENPDDDDLLTKLIARATDDVNSALNWQITDTDDYGTFVKNLIYKATAAQVEFYVLNGEKYNDDDSTGASIGKFSYSGSSGTNSGAVKLSPRTTMYLEQSGLMFAGIGTEYNLNE